MHMNKCILICLFLAITAIIPPATAQTDNEPADPKPGPQEAWNLLKKPQFVWGSTDVRYSRSQVPTAGKAPELYAWRGERVCAQALFATTVPATLSVTASDLTGPAGRIAAENIRCAFVRYLLTDTYNNRSDSFLMPDLLDTAATCAVAARTTRPLWITIRVPRAAAPGNYKGSITLTCNGKPMRLTYSLTVSKRTLPEPKDWRIHLDLWQNPYAVARYFNVPLWSEAHFDRMRPLMEQYAAAGGKVITTSIMQHPWKSQTQDPFESMIVKMKHIDGSWSYDYSVFDRWVEFMFSCGVTQQIDCYTIVPWGYTFEYVDMATSTLQHIDCKPGEPAYEAYMHPFLTDFARHLKAKGWFDRTCIAMDERPMDQFKAAFETLKRADPDFRIKGAIDYSPEISQLLPMMQDISLIHDHAGIPAEVVEQRRANRQFTTFYTCNAPLRPNTFTFSPPAEATWIGLHAAALGFDGYLRWAYNSWVSDPCSDSRFRKWHSGDCYLVYPTCSSIRFERLVQGIQDYEKICLLREETKNSPAGQKALEKLLEPFKEIKFQPGTDAGKLVREAEAALRKLE